jgi:hypothetical protein
MTGPPLKRRLLGFEVVWVNPKVPCLCVFFALILGQYRARPIKTHPQSGLPTGLKVNGERFGFAEAAARGGECEARVFQR